MKKFTFRKKTTLFYTLAITILASVLGFFYYSTQQIKTTSGLVVHTQDVIHISDAVLLDVLNIESGSRGFFISGQNKFLEFYTEGVAKVDNDLSLLNNQTQDNESQQLRLLELKKSVSERIALAKSIIEAKQRNETMDVRGYPKNNLPISNEGLIQTSHFSKSDFLTKKNSRSFISFSVREIPV